VGERIRVMENLVLTLVESLLLLDVSVGSGHPAGDADRREEGQRSVAASVRSETAISLSSEDFKSPLDLATPFTPPQFSHFV